MGRCQPEISQGRWGSLLRLLSGPILDEKAANRRRLNLYGELIGQEKLWEEGIKTGSSKA
jgi:hypothetical protein